MMSPLVSPAASAPDPVVTALIYTPCGIPYALLISDVTSKSCIYGIVNKQNTITMDFIEKFNNFSVIEKKEATKKLRKEDNKERKKKNKKVDLAEGQIGFFDIFKGGF